MERAFISALALVVGASSALAQVGPPIGPTTSTAGTSLPSLSYIGPASYAGCYWSDVNSCTPQNVRVRERMFVGNATQMSDTSATWAGTSWFPSSATTFSPGYVLRDAQLAVMADAAAGIGAAAAASQTQTNRVPIAIGGVAIQDSAVSGTFNSAWAGYFECDYGSASGSAGSPTYTAPYAGSYCATIEMDAVNFGPNYTEDPYVNNAGVKGLWIASGGAEHPANPALDAITITQNGSTFNAGIRIRQDAITQDANGNMEAIQLAKGAAIQWYTAQATRGASITSDAANTVKIGGLDRATSGSNQIITIPGILAGGATTDTPANNVLNIQGSLGVGTGAGGSVRVNVGKAGTTGNTQDTVITLADFNAAAQVITLGNTYQGVAYSNGGITIPRVQVYSVASGGNNAISVSAFNSGTASSPAGLLLGTSRGSSVSTQTAVVSGDQLGQILFDASDGTNFRDAARILVQGNGAVSTGVVPAQFVFSTANVSTGTLTDVLKMNSSQQVILPALATGTPVASLCVDTNGAVIKKTTTGACI